MPLMVSFRGMLVHCIDSILQVRRRIKSAPLAYYEAAPTSLFSDSETQFLGWTFKSEDSKRKNESADENGKIDKECDDSLVKRQ